MTARYTCQCVRCDGQFEAHSKHVPLCPNCKAPPPARLTVNWESFGNSIRAQAVIDAVHLTTVEKRLGISHARLVNAAQGKPVGTEIFLTLCHWMRQDPMWFCSAQAIEARSDETRSGSAVGESAVRQDAPNPISDTPNA